MGFFNDKQVEAFETGRYICSECGAVMKFEDKWELESEKNDEEFMKVFGVSQGYYMNDIVRAFDNLPEHAREQIGELIIAFKK